MTPERITIAALILIVAAVLLAVSAIGTQKATLQTAPALAVAVSASSSREALLRCQRITEPNAECSAVWAESRRHFLSRSASSAN